MKKNALFFLLLIFLFLIGKTSFAVDFYWENPQVISQANAQFPSVANSNNVSAIVWQEVDSKQNTIMLSARICVSGEWYEKPHFAGPFLYSGEVPNINSVTINKNGTVVITASSGFSVISVFTLQHPNAQFSEYKLIDEKQPIVGARVFALSNDSFMIFATQGKGEEFTLVNSVSKDGFLWSNFTVFEPAAGLQRAFVPTLTSFEGKDITVFQAAYESNYRFSYQLYSTVSKDGGNTWTKAELITHIIDTAENFQFTAYNNQRPNLLYWNNELHMVWERSLSTSQNSSVFYAQLSLNGSILQPITKISNNNDGTCFQPKIFDYDNTLLTLWFDTRHGIETVFLAQKKGAFWEEKRISSEQNSAVFCAPLFLKNELALIWQQNKNNGNNAIMFLEPDTTVLPPKIKPLSYTLTKPSTAQKVRFQLDFPQDSSGIAGYSYIWTQHNDETVPNHLAALVNENRLELDANLDGIWYLKVKTTDYAGNWSEPTTVTYTRDTTPPQKPVIIPPQLDSQGFVFSNTFTVDWIAPPEKDIAGYTYSLQYVRQNQSPSLPPARLLSAKPYFSFDNIENGYAAISVSAIDEVGNIGEPAVLFIQLNKFNPYTKIFNINTQTDLNGITLISILGRGFLTDGYVNTVYISKNGKAPYERILTLNKKDFSLASDRLITGIQVTDLEEGEYRIGLLHTKRGLYMSAPMLFVNAWGTVKTGDFLQEYIPTVSIQKKKMFQIQVSTLLLLIVCLFATAGFAVSIYGITGAAKETIQLKHEINALLLGEHMTPEKKHKTHKLKGRGISLKYKLMGFTATLVIMLILLVSLPLGFMMNKTQEQTLAKGLVSQINVLLDSISAGVRAYLPQKNILELGYLPAQSKALQEALTVTITGAPASGNNINLDYVWATNDPDILKKIDTPTLIYGVSRLTDSLSHQLDESLPYLEQKSQESVGVLSGEIEQLTKEAISLVLKNDSESVLRREEIQSIIRQLDDKVTQNLFDLAKMGAGAEPYFSDEDISSDITDFIFYKPVLYRQSSDSLFVRGVVRMQVNTQNVLKSISTARNNIIFITIVIAFIAISTGILGSLALASVIINPISKLAAHLALIRDTEDKEKLEGHDIEIKSKDEIGLLGEIVNDMTHGLVKAAAAQKDLTVGKEIQKMFIPLQTDSNGKKLTSGKVVSKLLDIFGYYEGAKGVSGDYFDVKQLDERHYAVIKCDVAGKGVPASLIMVEVATLFLDYFKDWNFKKNGYDMSAFVSRVNDLIESRGFKGRFAAFSLCILDAVSGDIHFCNAGDNMLHFYRAYEGKKETEIIPQTPAAGVFPSFMLDAKGGYKMIKRHLNTGDVLFMYTDGIEEAKRNIGQDNEEMGAERVNAIIEAVFAQKDYTLTKRYNAAENEVLQFDFSACSGTVEDCLMALVSVEKIFRMYHDPAATEHDRVLVDRKVDSFLNAHFKQYGIYCINRAEHSENPEYLWYTHIKEDPQYDDLTLLGIRKL